MTITAYISKKRRSARHPDTTEIQLTDKRTKAVGTEILLHNISTLELVFESDEKFLIGEPVCLKWPTGNVRSKVVWISGQLVGCDFDIPISRTWFDAAQYCHADASAYQSSDASQVVESFGARIRRLRLARGLSQAGLAKLVGVSDPAVCGWEADRIQPKRNRLEALADILRVSRSSLLGEEESNGLQTQIAIARAAIADAAGTTADRIRIHIEL